MRWSAMIGLVLSACVPGGVTRVAERAVADVGFADWGPADAQSADALIVPDAGLAEVGPADVGPGDLGFPDLGPPDVGSPDAAIPGFPQARGPASGVVMVAGGGSNRDYSTRLFRDLVGNRSAPVVVVPTARTPPVSLNQARSDLTGVGFTNVTVLHTTNPSEADTASFVAPLTEASGVWFTGGRQWRLADAYLGTRFMDELQGVLNRGGVLGGTSAGASIMGSFMVRGDTRGNQVVIGDHIVGFGYLDNIGVDQHVAQRGRQEDLFELVESYPDILGIGLDEPIAVVFMGDIFEVHGIGLAYVHYRGLWDNAQTNRDRYLRLSAGARFDVSTLSEQ